MTTPIAVVGMAGRFPGAADVASLWRNLCDGRCAIETGIDGGGRPTASAVLARADAFDAAFFDVPEADALIMDPQHRLLLESAWEALESAGYDPRACPGSVGIYAGCSFPTYLINVLSAQPALLAHRSMADLAVANAADSLTSRISYHLDLRGPSVTIQTFSSSSLVAVHMACRSLADRETDMALAGAASVKFPQVSGSHPAASATGRLRSFDAAADGTVTGNAVAMVVLKRLDDALRDHDQVHAVILGSAVNADGRSRPGFLAPGAAGKTRLLTEVLASAGIAPETLDYIEAHAMGTLIGDSIELSALAKVMGGRADATHPCVIGSIAANVGHLDEASGVAGLIKIVLMLDTATIPAQVGFTTPSAALRAAAPVLDVATRTCRWPSRPGPRRAGVSSFGIGGVNAHVVVEEFRRPRLPRQMVRGPHLLVLSARTTAGLDQMCQRLATHLRSHPDLALTDVAFTVQTGRTPWRFRRAVICEDVADAVAGLTATVAAAAPEHRDRLLTVVITADTPAGTDTLAVLRARARAVLALAPGRCEVVCALPGHPVAEVLAPQAARHGGDTIARMLTDPHRLLVTIGDDTVHTHIWDDTTTGRARIMCGPAALPALAARLWLAGVAVDWSSLHEGHSAYRVALPTYPFDRRPFWPEPLDPLPAPTGRGNPSMTNLVRK